MKEYYTITLKPEEVRYLQRLLTERMMQAGFLMLQSVNKQVTEQDAIADAADEEITTTNGEG